jgi:hypothetical protein
MEKGTQKLILYLALIAGLTTMIVTDHPGWAIVFLFMVFSVKN